MVSALYDIKDAIEAAQEAIEGMSIDQFCRSRLHFYAATRALEIISEASRQLPESVQARHPHLPWRSIRDAGNFYRHDYKGVQRPFVWKTIRDSLPSLQIAIEQELALLSDDS
jgi:uncharacterized protein with HEPN domain